MMSHSDAKIDKFKSKIRKLLALATSDNPHEAERARVQAGKMMRKHNISVDDVEILSMHGKGIRRSDLKSYEAYILETIESISGCVAYLDVESTSSVKGAGYSKRNSYLSRPVFIGIKYDVELACYAWEVLLRQLNAAQKDLKKVTRVGRQGVDVFSLSWAISACEKLSHVFGHKDPDKRAKKVLDKELGEDPRESSYTPSYKKDDSLTDFDRYNMMIDGELSGGSAVLLGAATDQSLKINRLGHDKIDKD